MLSGLLISGRQWLRAFWDFGALMTPPGNASVCQRGRYAI
jgi:hypothetical protein